MNLPTTLTETVKEFARAARADATIKAYASDVRVFAQWCERHGCDAGQPAPGTVAAFLASEAEVSAMATIERRVAAIVYFCRAAKLENPIDESVRNVLLGIRRKLGTAPVHAKQPLVAEQVRAMVDHIGNG